MDQNQDQQENGSPLLVVLFIGQLITLLAIAGLGWMTQNEVTALKIEVMKAANSPARAGQAQAPGEPARPQQPQNVEDWQSLVRPYNVTMGPEDAPVTIVEFSDFQCPFCSRFYTQTFGPLVDEYGDQVRFVYKHLPLTQIHPAATAASVAMQCAHREGKGWEMHDTLFDNYRSLSDQTIKDLASAMGLGDTFMNCYESQATRDEVEQDSEDAVRAGARGTPAFLINGKFMSGAQPLQNFKAEIDAILNN